MPKYHNKGRSRHQFYESMRWGLICSLSPINTVGALAIIILPLFHTSPKTHCQNVPLGQPWQSGFYHRFLPEKQDKGCTKHTKSLPFINTVSVSSPSSSGISIQIAMPIKPSKIQIKISGLSTVVIHCPKKRQKYHD